MTDDRGNPIKGVLVPHAGTEWPIQDRRIEHLYARTRCCADAPLNRVWFVVLLSICALMFLAVPRLLRGGVSPALTAIIVFSPLGAALLAGTPADRRAARLKRQRIAEYVLREGLCPCCGYNLHSIPIDPVDAVRVCPECGSAWKNNRIVRTAVFSGDQFAPITKLWNQSVQAEYRGSVVDAAGEKQPVRHQVRLVGAAAKLISEELSGRMIRARAELRHRLWSIRIALILATIVLSPAIALTVKGASAFRDQVVQLSLVVGVLTGISLSMFVPVRKRTLVRITLENGLCPSCLNILPDATGSQPNGNVCCPLCLAVWQRSPTDGSKVLSDRLIAFDAAPSSGLSANTQTESK